jgi:hypothetical protein
MTQAEKEPYTKLSAVDKLRFEGQLAELKKTGSYFTLEDGTKSTDKLTRPKKFQTAFMYFKNDFMEELRAQGCKLDTNSRMKLAS